MEHLITIFAVFMVINFFRNLLNKQCKSRMEVSEQSVSQQAEGVKVEEAVPAESSKVEETQADEEPATPKIIATCNLLCDTLAAMGCQPERVGDRRINVKYQGENFVFDIGGYHVRVWDLTWASSNVNDPGLAILREATNYANLQFGCTILLSAPDENGDIDIFSRHDFLIHPSFPENIEYLTFILNNFFEAKENLRNEFLRVKALREQPAQRPSRRPVGFATSDDTPADNTPS